MKVMLVAFGAALLIAFVAPPVLGQFGWSAADQTSSESVRLE
ncbi:hypothetical protein [Marinobacter salinisoli]|nr:hypothetical protein [Marinobacter salinisoli]